MKIQGIQRIIEIPLQEIQSINYEHNVRKYGNREDACICCGKPIKNSAKAKQIHLLTNGNIVSYSGDDIANSQGFFNVGPECANRLFIKFAF